MIGITLFDKLSKNNALKEAIGDAIFPVVIPQDQKGNCIVYYITSNDPDEVKNHPSTMDTYHFDVACIAKKYHEVDELSGLVRDALETPTPENLSIRYKTEADDFEPETQRFMRVVSFKMRYKR